MRTLFLCIFAFKMRRLIYIFILCLFTQASSAQTKLNETDASGKKQGKWVKKDQNGKTIYEGTFVNDIPTGEFKYYYDGGDLKAISVFSDKGKITRTKYFYAGTVLMAEGKYVDEKKDSIWRYYHDGTKLILEEGYLKGKKSGLQKKYNTKEVLIEEKGWKNDTMDGLWNQYYDDGSNKMTSNYINGLLEGEVKYYYPGKTLAVTGNYLHSFKQGKWIYYDNTGKITVMKENYIKSDLDGDFGKWSDRDGTPIMKGQYKAGKKVGKWMYYNKKGKLEKDTTFFAGYAHGASTEYFENGNKKHESNFFYDNQVGDDTEWDTSGVVVETKKFPSVDEMKQKLWHKDAIKKN